MATALELGKEGWKTFHGSITPDRELVSFDHVVELRQRVEKLAQNLKCHLGIKRVILFGSLIQDGQFDKFSDVDLAVEGLSAEQYWNAWRMAEDAIREHEIDIVDLDSATQTLKKAIQKWGKEI